MNYLMRDFEKQDWIIEEDQESIATIIVESLSFIALFALVLCLMGV